MKFRAGKCGALNQKRNIQEALKKNLFKSVKKPAINSQTSRSLPMFCIHMLAAVPAILL